MTQTRPNKAIVPINSDAYNLTGDLANMADSLTVTITVASQAERDALPTQPGLNVYRSDIDTIERWTGSAWVGSIRHAEFTGSAITTIANGGITFGTMTVDAASTFNGAFATGGTGGQITLNASGVYLFSVFFLPAANPSNTNLFIQTGGTTVAATVGGWYGSQQTTLTASFYAAAGMTYTFGCTTTNSVSAGSRVRVTKLQGR
jgi:hypothetical protein